MPLDGLSDGRFAIATQEVLQSPKLLTCLHRIFGRFPLGTLDWGPQAQFRGIPIRSPGGTNRFLCERALEKPLNSTLGPVLLM